MALHSEQGLIEVSDQQSCSSVPLNNRPRELLNPSCVHFPSLEFIIAIGIPEDPKFVTDLLTCRVRAIMVGKAEWKPLYLVLPRNRVNLK